MYGKDRLEPDQTFREVTDEPNKHFDLGGDLSLAKRLSTVTAVRSNLGCATCEWIETLSAEDRAALHEWIDNKMSISQLHEIASNDDDNPLPVSDSAFRNHIRRHHKAGE